jgi:hypothetical protein
VASQIQKVCFFSHSADTTVLRTSTFGGETQWVARF